VGLDRVGVGVDPDVQLVEGLLRGVELLADQRDPLLELLDS
jgi:hypothetical protein